LNIDELRNRFINSHKATINKKEFEILDKQFKQIMIESEASAISCDLVNSLLTKKINENKHLTRLINTLKIQSNCFEQSIRELMVK